MPAPYTLKDMRRFADETQHMLTEQQTQAHAHANNVSSRARQLKDRTDQPITLGVVGEFSVGKSLLLGMLLGKADLLPVENRKATGNITVLRLRQEPPRPALSATDEGPATAPDTDAPAAYRTDAGPTAEIHYLSREQLSACIRAILDGLAKGLDGEHPALRAGELLGDYDPLEDERGWAPFDTVAAQLWPSTAAGRPEPLVDPNAVSSFHRAAAAELCRIRDAVLSQSDVLGTSREIPWGLLRTALDHGTEIRVPEELPRRRVRPFGLADVVRDTDALNRSFVLIERVVQDVFVSPDHWRLHGLLDEHEVQFLDFPGIGGAGSYGRDRHLSRRELREVHTILVVLHALRAGSQGVGEFWGMLSADRSVERLGKAALVAASAFDLVPAPTLPEGTVSAADLRQRSDELHSIHVHADNFVRGREDAVVLTSAIAALRRYRLAYAGLSQQSRDHVDDARRTLDGKSGAADWKPLVDRFTEAEPDGLWAGRLRAYLADGGIDALQQLIEDHLRANGVAQKLDWVETARRQLWDALVALRYQVRMENGPGSATSAEYRELAEQLGRLRALLVTMAAQLEALLPSAAVRRTVIAGAAGTQAAADAPGAAVADFALPPDLAGSAARAHADVYEWGEWDQLLKRALADEDGLVSKSTKPRSSGTFRIGLPDTVPPPAGPDGGLAHPGKHSAPATSAEPGAKPTDTTKSYLTHFSALVHTHADADAERLEAWLTSWCALWNAELAPLRVWFGEALPRLREVYTAYLDDGDAAEERLGDLWTALHPEVYVAEEGRRYARETAVTEDVTGRFPGRPDHALPWHHALDVLDSMTEKQERHPTAVTQLRQYTADAAAAVVTERLKELLAGRLNPLHTFYGDAAQHVLAAHEIRRPRPGEGPEDDGARTPGGAGPDGTGGGDQPIDRLMNDWRQD